MVALMKEHQADEVAGDDGELHNNDDGNCTAHLFTIGDNLGILTPAQILSTMMPG